MKLYIHKFLAVTQVEGPGRRACIWVQGCSIRCPGCSVPWTWPERQGQQCTVDQLAAKIVGGPPIEGVTFLGGEPFDQARALAKLAGILRRENLSIMTFTGYVRENLERSENADWHALLAATDLLVDGPYLESQTDLSRPWIGSKNQRYHFLTPRYRNLEQHLHHFKMV